MKEENMDEGGDRNCKRIREGDGAQIRGRTLVELEEGTKLEIEMGNRKRT